MLLRFIVAPIELASNLLLLIARYIFYKKDRIFCNIYCITYVFSELQLNKYFQIKKSRIYDRE